MHLDGDGADRFACKPTLAYVKEKGIDDVGGAGVEIAYSDSFGSRSLK